MMGNIVLTAADDDGYDDGYGRLWKWLRLCTAAANDTNNKKTLFEFYRELSVYNFAFKIPLMLKRKL